MRSNRGDSATPAGTAFERANLGGVLAALESVLGPAEAWTAAGTVHDVFIQITEGVVAEERLEPHARVETGVTAADQGLRRLLLRIEAPGPCLRIGLSWPARPGERFTGLGARHGLGFDQSGRSIVLGADRRYTGPDCPPDLVESGGIPQGDYAPAPWLISSAGYALWLETSGPGARFDLGVGGRVGVSARAAAGPLILHVFHGGTATAQLRRYLALTGMPALLPEWAYGHWKSRDVYEHQSDVEDDWRGYRRNSLPLDAIVIDSPWETQYNTWEFNPHQFPDAPGLVRRMRADGVRTVVWVTPWMNVESIDGQRPPGPESERMHSEPAPDYAPAADAGHFVRDADGDPFVARWWMGTGSPVDFTSEAADRWWRDLSKRALDLGVAGIKADDGEGYYFPPDAKFADGRTGAEAAWAYGGLYRRSMQRALDEATGGDGVLFGRSGWTGQQAQGITWGGDQASDFWSLRTLVAATLTAAASGFSNWSHDVGGYLGERLMARCPKELLVRWLQFGCFTPLWQSHARFEQEAWTYDEETLELYRAYLLLHERLVPYIRAAAATAARCGLPIIRPLLLVDPRAAGAWTTPDAYGFGPALWVAPVLDAAARARPVPLPRGDWIDFWTHKGVEGGTVVDADAPLGRIPAWVRAGSIIVTHPDAHVARGLGDTPEAERPLEATLWGEPRLGRASARLADGTRVRWHRGSWSCDRPRAIEFRAVPGQ
jgi:alpha-glucosidase (family GH31 glycosyl hydrolase)